MKITRRQLRRIIRESLNEYAASGAPTSRGPEAVKKDDPASKGYSPILDMDNVADMQAALANRPEEKPEKVLKKLNQWRDRAAHPSQRRGMPFTGMGANAVMNALHVDDIWDEEEEALQKVVSDGDYQTMEEFAVLVADWFTKVKRGLHLTDEGQAKEMANWR